MTFYNKKLCFMGGEVTSISRDFCEVIGWDMTKQFRLKDTLSIDDRTVKNAIAKKTKESEEKK